MTRFKSVTHEGAFDAHPDHKPPRTLKATLPINIVDVTTDTVMAKIQERDPHFDELEMLLLLATTNKVSEVIETIDRELAERAKKDYRQLQN